MTSSVPHSAKAAPPSHSPHSPYSKNRGSAFGSCFDDYDDVDSNRRSQTQPQVTQSQTHFRIRSEADRTDTETSSIARLSVHSSQPTTPCAESHPSAFMRGVRSNTLTLTLDTPPSLGKSKDARLACRQNMEDAYAPATAEPGGGSGRPQKKELRIEDCTTASRTVFSPASALSATTVSMDTACTGGRDSSIFSFASSVPDAYLAALPTGWNGSSSSGANVCGGRRLASGNRTTSPPRKISLSPPLSMSVPAPPNGGVVATVVPHSPMTDNESSVSNSRVSKCKQRLQSLSRPAFDLKAVEEAQSSFLEEEEVCNAAQCYPLSEITPLLCVGTWKDAANPALLRRLGIKYVLNVARELDPATEANAIARNKDLIYESIPMSDCHSQDVSEHLRQAFEFIERARAANSRVLVHCRRGISRSPAIVVGYLMASEHRTYEEALKFVTQRRRCVSLNLAFQERLSEYVPSGEFYHGPPPPSPAPVVPVTAVSLSNPNGTPSGDCGVLPFLAVASSQSEHGSAGNNNNSGTSNHAASFCSPLLSHQTPHSVLNAVPLRRADDVLPTPPRGPLSASSSSNASSRASSNMRPAVSLAGMPSTTQNLSRALHRPRLTVHKKKKANSNTSASATPTSNTAPSPLSNTATPSSIAVATPTDVGGHPGKSAWLDEEVASSAAPSANCSSFLAESSQQLSLHPKAAKLAMQPIRGADGGRGFGEFGGSGRRAFGCDDDDEENDNNTSSSRRSLSSTADAEEDAEEPGSPFGLGSRRAFAHFNFSQASSSSNASPASSKKVRSFSEEAEEDNSATLPSKASSIANSASLTAVASTSSDKMQQRRWQQLQQQAKRSWSEEEEAENRQKRSALVEVSAEGTPTRCPQPPRRGGGTALSQTSAFDDSADDEGGEGSDGVEDTPTAGHYSDVQKPRLAVFSGRRTLLNKQGAAMEASSHTTASSSSRGGGVVRARCTPPVPLRAILAQTKESAQRSQVESPSHGDDSCSSASHGKTTGTVGGLSTTPYGTQGSLNDDTNLSTAQAVSHRSSLSG